ncbi:MAG: NAD-dependent epimerase/dehydratase family protein [Ferruginibacter sp.]|nr:NAD-dependent epimerase/dehydratase family protein [Ferruginibacter sp.]
MILVTGGAGLLGKCLIEQLLENDEKVKAIYNKTALTNFNNPNFTTEQCDILDVYALEDAMQNVTEIYHCAGVVSFNPKDEKKLFSINVEGTANVVNAALNAGVKKLVHVSSVAALGRIRPEQMITEKMEWTPETSNSQYGHSKYLGEMEVWRGVAEGLNAVVINPSIILGPGNWNEGSTKIFKSVYDEFPWYTEGISGFVDVKDVATAMIALMKSDITAEKFIVSAENISYQHLFSTIAKAFNKKEASKKVTPFMAALTWRLESIKSKFTGSSPLLTRETAHTAMTKVQYDNSKLLNALPNFKYQPLQESIEKICGELTQNLFTN